MTSAAAANTGAPWPIELLGRTDIEPTARLLAEAFHDNPCYVFMHPRRDVLHADLVAFFERNLRWREPLRLTFVARGPRGDVIGTGCLEPPGGVPATLGKALAHWVWPTLRDQGLHTLSRIVRAERAFAREQRLVAGGPVYWYVHAVAVRPDMQGRASGGAIMRRLLDEVRARAGAASAPIVLATQREANLTFYARLGFRVRHQATLGRTLRSAGFRSWFMRFEPRAPGPPT
jgi:GNAT superfamily N-acetyltransferase